jgi:synaptojanin
LNYETIMNEDLFQDLSLSPFKQDFVYFYGDFNYRVNLDKDEVMECIKKKNWTKLSLNDQLIDLKLKNTKYFKDFEEDILSFKPTYKFDKWSEQYDTGKKKRIPSYCDRIFIKSKKKFENFGYEVKYDEYSSDHRPVLAVFKNKI